MDVALVIALVGVGGVLAGAMITALVTLIGGWQTRRHEHRRWLLDRRLEAYSAMNATVIAWTQVNARFKDQDRRPERVPIIGELADRVQVLRLVAPKKTADLALELVGAIFTADHLLDQAELDGRYLVGEDRAEIDATWSAKQHELFAAQLVDLQGKSRRDG